MSCLVRIQDGVLLLHNWDNIYLFNSVHEHDFELPWLWDVNCGNNGYILITLACVGAVFVPFPGGEIEQVSEGARLG